MALATPGSAGADLVDELFATTWSALAARQDLPRNIRTLGQRLVGRVVEVERALASAGPITLVHGDASTHNVRTAPNGEMVLLDWEDVSAAPGVTDLAWLLVSSVDPTEWHDVIGAYGRTDYLTTALPAVVVQAPLCLSDTAEGSAEARGWLDPAPRRATPARRLRIVSQL